MSLKLHPNFAIDINKRRHKVQLKDTLIESRSLRGTINSCDFFTVARISSTQVADTGTSCRNFVARAKVIPTRASMGTDG